MPHLCFVSGLPRAGSTLLMNLLAQNPRHFVTPTSGLIHLMRAVIERWPNCQEFQTQGLETAKPMVLSALRGLLHGFFEEPLGEGKTVFDKSRGWVSYIEPLEEIFGHPVKVIVLLRDVRAIVASFEKIYRRRGIEFRYQEGDLAAETQSVENRAAHALSEKSVTGRSIARVRDALTRCPDRLLLIPYNAFTLHPQETMDALHAWLGLAGFTYDSGNVKQVTHEDDNYIGADLHRIRPRIEPPDGEEWKGLLPGELSAQIGETYDDLNRLSAGEVVEGTRCQG